MLAVLRSYHLIDKLIKEENQELAANDETYQALKFLHIFSLAH